MKYLTFFKYVTYELIDSFLVPTVHVKPIKTEDGKIIESVRVPNQGYLDRERFIVNGYVVVEDNNDNLTVRMPTDKELESVDQNTITTMYYYEKPDTCPFCGKDSLLMDDDTLICLNDLLQEKNYY